MAKKLEELQKEDIVAAQDHFDLIKEKVDNGSYFKDALDWYFFRYVTAICDRTMLIFGSIIAAVVFYFLLQMINGAFPLEVKSPVFVRAYDQSQYFPNLVHLKPKADEKNYDPAVKTVDEAVLKYLVSNYVEDRESYDFSKAEVEEVNTKFNRIKNISSEMQYRKFQLFMSKDNPDSPIHNFGINVKKKVQINSVKFVETQATNFASKAISYIAGKIPSEAEVRLTALTEKIDENEELKVEKQDYLVKVSFTFNGVSKPEAGIRNIIKFVVNDYQLFKIN
jgi:type IV secretory pathway component VirB8